MQKTIINTKPFRVRDLRIKEKFCVDDAYVNGWAKHLKPSALAVYVSLCRHADKEQSAFPSQETIAKEHGIGVRTVKSKIKLLEQWNIIKREKVRSKEGKWLNNTYYLLDKSHWKQPGADFALGVSTGKKEQSQGQPLHLKETHLKATHNKREINKEKSLTSIKGKYSTLESLGETEFVDIAQRYGVPLPFVTSKYDDLMNYCQSTGKGYSDYFAALRNFVKRDALQIRKEVSEHVSKRGIDARGVK
jgi:hypothetical protein